MPANVRRTVLHIKAIIETSGNYEEHKNSVTWVSNQVLGATRFMRNGSVATEVRDGATGDRLGFSGNGVGASGEAREILDEFFEAEPTQ